MAAAPESQPAFSLALTQDQQDIRDRVHGFAAGVVRPAAADWDEREETPWPVISEAAKIQRLVIARAISGLEIR